MIYAYIGVALVVGLLVGFAALAVYWMAKSVTHSIRSKTLELVSVYDDLLEAQSRALAQIRREAQKAQTNAPTARHAVQPSSKIKQLSAGVSLNMVARISAAKYRDGCVGDLYRKIREGFNFSPESILNQMKLPTVSVETAPATRLIEELSCETVCALTSLQSQEQYRLLHETLAPPQKKILEQYYRSERSFNGMKFYDYLSQIANTEPKAAVMRVAPGRKVALPKGMVLVEDDEICEGFQLEVGGRIYDYCIKVREIS